MVLFFRIFSHQHLFVDIRSAEKRLFGPKHPSWKGPLLHNELSVPGKQGIRVYERFDFIKHLTAKDFGLRGQSPALIVCEPKTLSFKLFLKDTILFDEIFDARLLMAVKPSGEGDYQEMERL